jgi:hypothetical protein
LDLSADDLRQVLAENGIVTVLIGAHAANRYRLEARHTVDVDYLASSLEGAALVLREVGCTVREVAENGVPYLISARVGATVIDVLVAETAYQKEAMSRARDGVLTVEDVIIHKLIAARPRDIDDIRSILSTRIALDESYVEDKAGQWEVLDCWIQLRSER